MVGPVWLTLRNVPPPLRFSGFLELGLDELGLDEEGLDDPDEEGLDDPDDAGLDDPDDVGLDDPDDAGLDDDPEVNADDGLFRALPPPLRLAEDMIVWRVTNSFKLFILVCFCTSMYD